MDSIPDYVAAEGIELERIRREGEFSMTEQHIHPGYEVYYLLEGERYYFIGSHTYRITPGCLVLIGQNQIHKTTAAAKAPHERILLQISQGCLQRLEQRFGHQEFTRLFSGQTPVLPLKDSDRQEAERLLLSLQQELLEQKTRYQDQAELLLTQLFLLAFRAGKTGLPPMQEPDSPKHQKVGQIAAYLSTHYTEIQSLDQLCSHFFISKYYLCRIFKEVTGFTVNTYLNQNRISRARELLACTSRPVTEIAETVGYDSITYFEKVFRSFSGCSPSRYRKSQKESR